MDSSRQPHHGRASGVTAWLNAVEFVDGVWFIAGNQGTMLISTDATNWVNSGTITRKSLYGLTIHEGQLIAVGSEGVVIRSQLLPAQTPKRISNYSRVADKDIFLFTGQPDQLFYLEDTEDFSSWPPRRAAGVHRQHRHPALLPGRLD